ncbi:MAG TPA: metalloregulator ArsR/SmtB family transcription factor [Solirubrobacterales bacterium]|jgi:DNA-binding transcriptional ArsR family regulator|nr:metalloregulator ArsR/SmtB family transcription factor [Solirubrobacterales bacterium]
MTRVDAVFTALADPTRRRVLETLATDGTVTASRLARSMPISRQAVSKHLASLRAAKLVSSERVGRETVYTLSPEPLEDAAAWIERVGAEWDERLETLRRALG